MLDPIYKLVNKYLSTRIAILTAITGTKWNDPNLNKGTIYILDQS